MGEAPISAADQGDLAHELARIQAAVDRGETDLKALGFWRVVGRVKRDPALVERFADQIGRIDREAFETGVRLRFPVWFGNAVLLAGLLIGGAGLVVARRASSEAVAGVALLVSSGAFAVGVHDLAHWVVGRAVGMRFTAYFMKMWPPPPRPGIKTDYASYLRTPPSRRALMHAAGALASKVGGFVPLFFWPLTKAPVWAAIAVAVFAFGTVLTDVLWSVRSSDWKRVRRELRVARAYTGNAGSSGQPG
ncbi:MAG: hypothetical protein WD276_08540 [Actinomycetota bacterium]